MSDVQDQAEQAVYAAMMRIMQLSALRHQPPEKSLEALREIARVAQDALIQAG